MPIPSYAPTEPGTKVPFSREEYAARHARVRAAMAELDLDLLLVNEPAHMCYLTGYDASTYYVPQMVVLAAAGGDPFWMGREQDLTGSTIASIMSPDEVAAYPDPYVDSYGEHAVAWMCRELVRRGLGRGRIGVELDAHYFTGRTYLELQAGLPEATLVDADRLVSKVRLTKSEAELACMREAAVIVEQAMRTGIDAIRPGVRGCDVAGEIYNAQVRGTPEHGGDYPCIQPLVVAGARTATPHLGWTDEPLPPGVGVNIEIAGVRHRYHAALARTIHIGPAPAHLRSLASAVNDALDTALATIRPGIEAQAYEAAFRAELAKFGFEKPSRIGYPIGIGYPPNWGERSVSFRPGDATILQPGMAFHTIPGCWQDGYGYIVSTTFVVTDGGIEELTRSPRELVVVA